MAEEQFQQSERQRIETEKKKQRLQLGLPPIETATEQLTDEHRQIQVILDNSSMREAVKAIHEEFQQVLVHQQNTFESNQHEALQLFESELKDVSDKLSELIDNFNLFVAQERTERKLHRERVQKTCDKIDREINL